MQSSKYSLFPPLLGKGPHHWITKSCFSCSCAPSLWSCKFCVPCCTKDALDPNLVNSWVVRVHYLVRNLSLKSFRWISAWNPSLPFLGVIIQLPSNYIIVFQGIWRHFIAVAVELGHWGIGRNSTGHGLCSTTHQYALLLGLQGDWSVIFA